MVIDSSTVLILCLTLGFMLLFTGLINAMLAYWSTASHGTACAPAIVACAGIAWFEPALLRVVVVLSVVFATTVTFIQSQRGQAVLRKLRTPLVAWTVAIVAGGSMMASGPLLYEKISQAEANQFEDVIATLFEANTSTHEDNSTVALTDKDQPIKLLLPDQIRTRPEMLNAERAALPRVSQVGSTIHRMPAWDSSNCHGWVFSAGHFQIGGLEVNKILADNGYVAGNPTIGGIAVYRNSDNSIAHTAIVRFILPDGTVMVEGKWGWMGVFLHEAEVSPYGNNLTYYTSHRNGHVLKGLQDKAPYYNPRTLIR